VTIPAFLLPDVAAHLDAFTAGLQEFNVVELFRIDHYGPAFASTPQERKHSVRPDGSVTWPSGGAPGMAGTEHHGDAAIFRPGHMARAINCLQR
jgi:hypothetical protein